MRKRNLIIVITVVILGGIWYAFRPERLFIDKQVNEAFPGDSIAQAAVPKAAMPSPLTSGRFHDGAHKTTGIAAVYQLPDGKRVLRLSEFETSNGPDVQLYMVAAADATDNATVTKAGFVSLGALKGNKGDQNYDVPSTVDLSKYRAVTVWCRRFSVNFGTAPLSLEEMAPAAQPAILAEGRFHDGAHKTMGKASIYRLPDGRRILRLSEFETSNGPDVQLYLVAAADAKDNRTVTSAGFVSLGPLKGNRGDQNYDLPADADLAKYRAVTVWCRRFSVNFGTAPLSVQ